MYQSQFTAFDSSAIGLHTRVTALVNVMAFTLGGLPARDIAVKSSHAYKFFIVILWLNSCPLVMHVRVYVNIAHAHCHPGR